MYKKLVVGLGVAVVVQLFMIVLLMWNVSKLSGTSDRLLQEKDSLFSEMMKYKEERDSLFLRSITQR